MSLLDPRLWLACALVALGLFGSGYVAGRHQQHVSDTNAQAAVALKATEQARQVEANWQTNTEALQEVHDDEVRRIAADRDRALAGLRQRAGQRLPEAATCTADGAGATGRQLSQADADFLVRLAADADRTAADLRACQAWAATVTR